MNSASADRTPLIVGYDGGCGPCRWIWAVLSRLAGGQRVVGVDVNDPTAVAASALCSSDPVALVLDMHVRRGDQVAVGFHAWRLIVRAVPALWPLLIVFWLPGSTRAGTWIYRRIADSRSCAVQRHLDGLAIRRP